MRSLTFIATIALASACGGSDSTPAGPDAYTGNNPPPRIIPGGGIGDGAIDGDVNPLGFS